MMTYTNNYKVTGSGTISCETDAEYEKSLTNINKDSKFTLTASDPIARKISYSMNFTVME